MSPHYAAVMATARAARQHSARQPPAPLLVLADFDRTLTAYRGPAGGVGEECHDVIFNNYPNRAFKVAVGESSAILLNPPLHPY